MSIDPFNSADGFIEHEHDDVFDPPYEAVKLRRDGLSWRETAQLTGYASEVSCAVAVRTYLQNAALRQEAERKQEALDMELMRLDELQRAFWTSAMRGDDKSANVVLKVIAQRAKMLQIDGQTSENKEVSRTILVMGGDKQYSQTLQEIVQGIHDKAENEE